MTSRRLLLLGALTLAFASSAGFARAEDDPIQNEEAKPAPKAKKKPAKKKAYDYDRSKYKSRSPYRFSRGGGKSGEGFPESVPSWCRVKHEIGRQTAA